MKVDNDVLKIWKKLRERQDVAEIGELIKKQRGEEISRQFISRILQIGEAAPDIALIITEYYAGKKRTTEEVAVNAKLREVLK